MQLWAAIDILRGRAVSLVKGDASASTVWKTDPLTAARKWEQEGADGLHLVDLDRALGSGTNGDAIRRILKGVGIPVQVGGGIRSVNDALSMLKAGAARIVVGTMAFRQPEALRELVGKKGAKSVVAAADYKEGMVVTHGWLRREKMDVFQAVGYLEKLGVGTTIVTATERDGTGRGPDLETFRKLRQATGMRILASGGIRSNQDVKELSELGIEGAIVGRALYDGSVQLGEIRRAAK